MILEIILIVVGVIIVAFLYKIYEKLTKGDATDIRLKDLNQTLDNRLNNSTEQMTKQMGNQFEASQKTIKEITEELTEVKAASRQMLDLSSKIETLEGILKNPKQRGSLGEYMLEQVLSNVLPPEIYESQYTFETGVRADAIIRLSNDRIIAIDSKFPLENYTKLIKGDITVEKRLIEDIKERIKETSKYIIPNENTLDFAFMYIPSESLYYDLLSNKIGMGNNLIEYAFNTYKVIIISPTTLLAYLQTVNLGLSYLKIEKDTMEIIKKAEKLQTNLTKYSDVFDKVGKNLNTVVNQYNDAQKRYRMIDGNLVKLTGKGGDFEQKTVSGVEE